MSDAYREATAHLTAGHPPRHPHRTRHVVPCGDVVRHEAADDCVCGPDQRPLHHEDGTLCGWLAIHSRLNVPDPGAHHHLTGP